MNYVEAWRKKKVVRVSRELLGAPGAKRRADELAEAADVTTGFLYEWLDEAVRSGWVLRGHDRSEDPAAPSSTWYRLTERGDSALGALLEAQQTGNGDGSDRRAAETTTTEETS